MAGSDTKVPGPGKIGLSWGPDVFAALGVGSGIGELVGSGEGCGVVISNGLGVSDEFGNASE